MYPKLWIPQSLPGSTTAMDSVGHAPFPAFATASSVRALFSSLAAGVGLAGCGHLLSSMTTV